MEREWESGRESENLQNTKFPKFTKETRRNEDNLVVSEIDHMHAIQSIEHVKSQIATELVAF